MRFVTEKTKPSNIATFRAATLDQAIREADRLTRKKGVMGAVWLRDEFNHASFNTEQDRALIAAMMSDLDKPKAKNVLVSNFLTAHLPQSATLKQFLKDMQGQLASAFSSKVSINITALNNFPHHPHIDHYAALCPNPFKIFRGRLVHIVTTLQGKGTAIYDPQDISHYKEILKNPVMLDKSVVPWHIRKGDWLFFPLQGLSGTNHLLHCAPEVSGKDPKKRIAMVMSCRA